MALSARKRTKQEKVNKIGLGTGLVRTNCDGDFSATLEMTRGTASPPLEMTRWDSGASFDRLRNRPE